MPTIARRVLFVLLAALAVLAAGCGDNGDSGGGDGSPSAGSGDGSGAGADATVAVASTSLGEVLVDGDGRTLYLFTKDKDDTSTCSGGCASAWPALTVEGEPVAGEGVDEAKLATNAAGQVTYGGQPLYRYAQDAEAGDVEGQGVGGVWFAVDAEGQAVQSSAGTDDTDPTPSY